MAKTTNNPAIQAACKARVAEATRVEMSRTRQAISDATGFDQGEMFTTDAQVRAYFTPQAQREMFGDDAETDPETLRRMAETVIAAGWHCRRS